MGSGQESPHPDIEPVVFLCGQGKQGFPEGALDGAKLLPVCLFLFRAALCFEELDQFLLERRQCLAERDVGRILDDAGAGARWSDRERARRDGPAASVRSMGRATDDQAALGRRSRACHAGTVRPGWSRPAHTDKALHRCRRVASARLAADATAVLRIMRSAMTLCASTPICTAFKLNANHGLNTCRRPQCTDDKRARVRMVPSSRDNRHWPHAESE